MTIGRKRGHLGLARLSLLAAAALGAAILMPRAAAAASERILHIFERPDGSYPVAGLIMDAAGNLYGTTQNGGTSINCNVHIRCGVVFKLAPDGTYTVLYDFQGGRTDGANPQAGLIMDAAGNFYGTTEFGGITTPDYFEGSGVVFKLAPDGTRAILYSFCLQSGCADGAKPVGGLVMDAAGNLYGTTYAGGTSNQGVAFAVAPDETQTVLANGGPYAANPRAGLLMDAAGNLYGTTFNGGASNQGVVFEIAHDGTKKVLADGGPYAANPAAGLIIDAAGNLYGTTEFGGIATPDHPQGGGVVFKLAPDGTGAILYSFCSQSGCADGAGPVAGLIMDAAGNLYGTTAQGGIGSPSRPNGNGLVFKLAPDGTYTVLYSFQGLPNDGANPLAGLIMDAAGNLYGTTFNGGSVFDQGALFEVTP